MKSKKPSVPLNCLMREFFNPDFACAIMNAKKTCFKYNKVNPTNHKKRKNMIKQLFGSVGEGCVVCPPFWCDYGYKIEVGNNFYSNHNLVILDGGGVKFGDNVFVAPNCVFTTAEHAIDPELRKQGFELAKPITVGNNVWIGAGVTVLAGVTIGDNSVIGAGSVVTGDIPANVVAVGVPCKAKRQITEADKTTYTVFNSKSL